MKKIMALLLALSLCLSMAACGTGNDDHDYILSLLEKGEYDMAIYVIEGLRDGKAGAPQNNQPKPADQGTPQQNAGDPGDQEFMIQAENNGSDWVFNMELHNHTNDILTLQSLVINELVNGQPTSSYGFEGQDLAMLPFGHLELAPGESIPWLDMRPLDVPFEHMQYVHTFRNQQGQEVRIIYTFELSGTGSSGGDALWEMQEPSGDWSFPCLLENTSDTPWKLVSMDITHLMNDSNMGTTIFETADLERIGLGGLVLQPGETHSYVDGHPVVSDWNGAEYRFHFTDGNHQTQVLTFHFDDLDKQAQGTDYSQDSGKDLKTLRHDAAFETEVYSGVYWVPAVSLGTSRYSNMDIYNMRDLSPEEKQQKISTLYEALQLYQVGNFTPSDDNVRVFENGISWEHHKPGYHAVRTNTGCCATDSNWLRYILDGDYEEVGYIATSQPDGSGHIFNYILQDGWYYIIDLTHYHATGPLVTANEDGTMNSYRRSDYILGNIHKTRNIQSYVDYTQRDFNEPPALMFQYTAQNCLAVDGAQSQSGVQIIYEDAGKDFVKVIYDNPNDSVSVVWKESPKNLPDWNKLP